MCVQYFGAETPWNEITVGRPKADEEDNNTRAIS
jgi:hypothetical protein